MSFTIRPFKPESRRSGSVNFIVGPRCSGKKTLLRGLVDAKQYAEKLVISQTAPTREILGEFLGGQECTIDSYDEEAVRRVMHSTGGRKLLIFADVLRNTPHCDAIIEMVCTSRIADLDVYITGQSVLVLSSITRANVDYVFALGTAFRDCRKALHRTYFGHLGTFKIFEQAFDACTSGRTDRGAMVLDIHAAHMGRGRKSVFCLTFGIEKA
ncbi:VV A32-like virion packaging ATPase [Acanthamoeba castellanii medusavirus]|uniref:VV A32-like virion packaging ATPase n=1 Tax=Acanthamoeba castellanii medusavirus J1 TaxID=3114988 RepID=A0A3T1CX70_9VIRU|nr:VV A32-like virion packaging ATPase [Acanthamoeba castellanii medusavirus]BBI30442.1 VV A32-like virion packaging ATPase [Acanthamoeba castellanii medusavirus J1]